MIFVGMTFAEVAFPNGRCLRLTIASRLEGRSAKRNDFRCGMAVRRLRFRAETCLRLTIPSRMEGCRTRWGRNDLRCGIALRRLRFRMVPWADDSIATRNRDGTMSVGER